MVVSRLKVTHPRISFVQLEAGNPVHPSKRGHVTPLKRKSPSKGPWRGRTAPAGIMGPVPRLPAEPAGVLQREDAIRGRAEARHLALDVLMLVGIEN